MPDYFREVLKQINTSTLTLVERSLVSDQNMPTTHGNARQGVISVTSSIAPSDLMAEIPYPDLYDLLVANRHFNLKFRDGALVQFHYTFKQGRITSHRIAFLPSPELESLQDDPELYLDDRQELFADWLDQRVVGVPMRFDHDVDAGRGLDHPESHFTIGQFTNCRIPVTAPLFPLHFVDFVIRNFYNSTQRVFSDGLPTSGHHFPDCATEDELAVLHVGVPKVRQNA